MKLFPQLIINADDFGLCSAVNEAVAQAHEAGTLTSATIMANMPGFDEAVTIAKKHPTLGVGVHVNLLRGKPLSDVPSLMNAAGHFIRLPQLWKRFFFNRVPGAQMEQEIETQIKQVVDAGLHPTHVDSEKHLHLLFPPFGRALIRVAKKWGITKIRLIRESLSLLPSLPRPQLKQLAKTIILNRQSAILTPAAKQHGFRFPDQFFGVAYTGRMTTEVWTTVLENITNSTTEIMIHPAVANTHHASWLDEARVAEYRALLDPRTKEALLQNGVQLIHYENL